MRLREIRGSTRNDGAQEHPSQRVTPHPPCFEVRRPAEAAAIHRRRALQTCPTPGCPDVTPGGRCCGRLRWAPLRLVAGALLGWARPPEYPARADAGLAALARRPGR
ncbi:hypothetical protein GCM10009802_05020 [Streptomyces synnematoformans]|uniref:Uncharacterized protein n=1 Tax=Streptomyces synnematoformans TaxID=415721 RepID=A0ABN2XF01_9ACTN